MQTAREKIEEIYKLYEKPMYYIALAVLKDHHQAEDAVSDSFFRIISHLDKLGDPKAPETKHYIIKTVRSVAISKYRKNMSESKRLVTLDETACVSDCFEHLFDENKADEILQLLSPLSDTDFEIVVMRGRDSLPYSEISRRTGLSESAVRKRYERARKAVINYYKERRETDE